MFSSLWAVVSLIVDIYVIVFFCRYAFDTEKTLVRLLRRAEKVATVTKNYAQVELLQEMQKKVGRDQ